MNAWTSFSASETGNMFQSLAMFLRWKNAVFVTWEIWFSKDKLLSNITTQINWLLDWYYWVKCDLLYENYIIQYCFMLSKLLVQKLLGRNNKSHQINIYLYSTFKNNTSWPKCFTYTKLIKNRHKTQQYPSLNNVSTARGNRVKVCFQHWFNAKIRQSLSFSKNAELWNKCEAVWIRIIKSCGIFELKTGDL